MQVITAGINVQSKVYARPINAEPIQQECLVLLIVHSPISHTLVSPSLIEESSHMEHQIFPNIHAHQAKQDE